MRFLFVGDVVGRSGRAALLAHLPALRTRWKLDFVVVNGENAAGGFGITESICDEFLAAGADAVKLGNHAFDQSRGRYAEGFGIARHRRCPDCRRSV